MPRKGARSVLRFLVNKIKGDKIMEEKDFEFSDGTIYASHLAGKIDSISPVIYVPKGAGELFYWTFKVVWGGCNTNRFIYSSDVSAEKDRDRLFKWRRDCGVGD